MTAEHRDSRDNPGAADLEQALTRLAWEDPSIVDDPTTALARLGVDVPSGMRVDLRVQRPDTLYLVIPPSASEVEQSEEVVNQMDLWRSGEQFVWIMPQEAKVGLLEMREQFRDSDDSDTGRMNGDRFSEHYRLLSSDPKMRAELLADPKAALASYFGAVVEGDYRIEVIEQRPDTITAVIPTPPEQSADPTARLAEVSGRSYDMLHTSGIGGYLIPSEALTWVLRDMRKLWATSNEEADEK